MTTATLEKRPSKQTPTPPPTCTKHHVHIFIDLTGATPRRKEIHGHCKAGEVGVKLGGKREVTFEANLDCDLTFSNPDFFEPPDNKSVHLVAGVEKKLIVAATGTQHQEECYYVVSSKNSGDPDPVIQP